MEIKYSENSVENLNINSITVDELLKNIGLDPLEVIVKREGTVILDNDVIGNDDRIEIIRVIHGG